MLRVLCFFLALALGGCGLFDFSPVTTGDPIIENEAASATVDLVVLLDPKNLGIQEMRQSSTPQSASIPLLAAYRGFYDRAYCADLDELAACQKDRRNGVQETLINASISSCDEYKNEIQRFRSNTDFLAKATSGALGTAGALVTGGASQILSGAGAAALALGETVNETMLKELTLKLINDGIDAKRNDIRAEIAERQKVSIENYLVQTAVGDALRYHNACTLRSGLQKAGEEVAVALVESEIARGAAFTDPAAQKRVDAGLDLSDQLKVGAAWQILQNPPSPLDAYTRSAVQGRLGGTPLDEASGKLGGPANDGSAKAILKMILVLMEDRSDENLQKWTAAMEALKKPS